MMGAGGVGVQDEAERHFCTGGGPMRVTSRVLDECARMSWVVDGPRSGTGGRAHRAGPVPRRRRGSMPRGHGAGPRARPRPGTPPADRPRGPRRRLQGAPPSRRRRHHPPSREPAMWRRPDRGPIRPCLAPYTEQRIGPHSYRRGGPRALAVGLPIVGSVGARPRLSWLRSRRTSARDLRAPPTRCPRYSRQSESAGRR